MNETEITDPLSVKKNIVNYGLALSCKSFLLKTLIPSVYAITYSIPNFLLIDKCIGPCNGKIERKGPRYRKSIILAAGAHLTLVCPE